MFLQNHDPDYRKPLDPVDAETLGVKAADEVERYLSYRDNHAPTPLHSLRSLSDELDVGAIHVKDEGYRLGLGSFKALGGSLRSSGWCWRKPAASLDDQSTSPSCTRLRSALSRPG
jgi:threonine dehydratase